MLPVAPSNYSAKDTAITQRPTSTALFVVDSEDRFENYTAARAVPQSSPYDFRINLPASLMNGFFTRIGVSEVVFPWNIPNVNKKTNKIIVQSCANGPIPQAVTEATITLTPGFYTPAELAAEVQRLVRLSAAGLPNFTMIYAPVGAASENAPVFQYDADPIGFAKLVGFKPMTPLSAAWTYPDSSRQLFDVLGLSASNTGNSTTGANLKETAFSGPTFAQACRYVDIISPQLTYNQALKDTGSQKVMRDTLCRIYIVDPANIQSTIEPSSAEFCPPGCAPTIIYRNFTTPKQIQWLPNQPIVGSLQFQVYDDEGDLLSTIDALDSLIGPSRMNWSLSLLVSEN
jgi:hypothetical protein